MRQQTVSRLRREIQPDLYFKDALQPFPASTKLQAPDPERPEPPHRSPEQVAADIATLLRTNDLIAQEAERISFEAEQYLAGVALSRDPELVSV